jgi:DNA topoisomerase IB
LPETLNPASPDIKLPPVVVADPAQTARAAGLRYVSDDLPGIRRQPWGRGFSYFDAEGDRIQDDEDFTSKDFRTWAGTACTAQILNDLGEPKSRSEAQANIREAIQGAAKHLGNRVATCRNFYVHPAIPQPYEAGWLLEVWHDARAQIKDSTPQGLTPDESALIAVLSAERQNSP